MVIFKGYVAIMGLLVRIKLHIICLLLFAFLPLKLVAAEPIPRTIFAFYDAEIEGSVRYSLLHRSLEMPLNWLGYHLEFHESHAELPEWRDDVAGAVLSLPSGAAMADMQLYVDWLKQGMIQHKKFLVFGNIGFEEKWVDGAEGRLELDKLLAYLGITNHNQWVGLTYNSEIAYKNMKMVEYERKYPASLPSYPVVVAKGDTQVFLKIKGKTDSGEELVSDLVTINQNGGYIAEEYAIYVDNEIETNGIPMQRWLINPFDFLNKALDAKAQPRPDVTTLNGRRIFYSHLDGDGWNNYSEVNDHKDKPLITAQVLFEHIYKHYDKLPFTVAPIVAELDPNCHGLPQSAEIAREIFALPNVEPASHTHSHPLMWRYFDDLHPAAELKYLNKYPPRASQNKSIFDLLSNDKHGYDNAWHDILEKYTAEDAPSTELDKLVMKDFTTPRSYACQPFDMDLEITGAADYLQKLAPANKKIRLLQWSGDTSPTEKALRKTREAGMLNINGGDSRFDPLFSSYSVSPIGIQAGKERQIYSSNSNENTHTSLWRDNFSGFRHLVNTVRNTETPRRISPFNIYYHAYSGEKNASLQALKQNIDYAMTQAIIPIFASEYAKIANGFYSAEFLPLAENKWQVKNRGALQTIRFDNSTILAVDFEQSEGVIGQRHYQGSLYVFLNPSNKSPIISLKTMGSIEGNPQSLKPYLIASNWQIKEMNQKKDGISFKAQGFGNGKMQFYWPISDKVEMKIFAKNKLLHKDVVDVTSNSLKLWLKYDAKDSLVINLMAIPQV